MQIKSILKNQVSHYLSEQHGTKLSPDQVIINDTKKEFEGDLTVVCFPLTQHTEASPPQTAKAVGQYLEENLEEVEKFNVIQGFLNVVIADEYWTATLFTALEDPGYWHFPQKEDTILVEFSSPNTNKPQHLGHIRNNLLGFALAQTLEAYGYRTIKVNLFNDRGRQIFQSILAWQKWGEGITPEQADVKGDQLVGDYYVKYNEALKKQVEELQQEGLSEKQARKEAPLAREVQQLVRQWERGDEEVIALWEKLNSWVYEGFEETYKSMGIIFDEYDYESETYKEGKAVVQEGLEKEVFYRAQNGSVWVDLSDYDLDKKLLLREDGTSVYITQDLGTIQQRYEKFKMGRCIYVVGSEQNYHFKVLRAILDKLDKPFADGVYHLSYGMIKLPSGKMKSREGTVVDADDLIQEMIDTAREYTRERGKVPDLKKEKAAKLYKMIGLGALKFHLLKVESQKDIMFNPEETIDFQGHTGPFIQYTYARIQSVLRKFEARFKDLEEEIAAENYTDLLSLERELIIENAKLPDAVADAAQNYAPSNIAHFSYELAKCYNKFYAEVPILNADEEQSTAFRIQLSRYTAQTIKSAMQLLGIKLPERM